MIDLFGPASAPGATTVRPTENRAFGITDTFFKDCSSPTVDDGTEFQAAWFNQVLANWRALGRANGQTIGGVDIVTQDNTDDNLVLKAVQHLVQRGFTNYAQDSGTADAMVVALTPALAEYKAGSAPIRVKKGAAANATTTPTINVNGLGAVTITRFDGTALAAGELGASSYLWLAFDGTVFRVILPQSVQSFRPLSYFLASGSIAQGIPVGVDTKVTNVTNLIASNLSAGSSYSSATFTCGAADAGAWIFMGYGALELLTTASSGNDYRMSIAKNGATGAYMTTFLSPSDTYGITVTTPVLLANGDTAYLNAFQSSGATRNLVSTQLIGMRMGASS